MCKLVEDPAEVLPLMPRLEPLVKNATEKISDPEARGVAEKAYKTLQKAAGEGAQSLQQAAAHCFHRYIVWYNYKKRIYIYYNYI